MYILKEKIHDVMLTYNYACTSAEVFSLYSNPILRRENQGTETVHYVTSLKNHTLQRPAWFVVI